MARQELQGREDAGEKGGVSGGAMRFLGRENAGEKGGIRGGAMMLCTVSRMGNAYMK